MSGKTHQHKDGRIHSHYSEGFTIGNQTIPDDDGTAPHQHGTLNMSTGDQRETSGPVVRIFGLRGFKVSRFKNQRAERPPLYHLVQNGARTSRRTSCAAVANSEISSTM
jgi:hypothetical protein